MGSVSRRARALDSWWASSAATCRASTCCRAAASSAIDGAWPAGCGGLVRDGADSNCRWSCSRWAVTGSSSFMCVGGLAEELVGPRGIVGLQGRFALLEQRHARRLGGGAGVRRLGRRRRRSGGRLAGRGGFCASRRSGPIGRLLARRRHVPRPVVGRVVDGARGGAVGLAVASGRRHVLSAGGHDARRLALPQLPQVQQHQARTILARRKGRVGQPQLFGLTGQRFGPIELPGGNGLAGLADQLDGLSAARRSLGAGAAEALANPGADGGGDRRRPAALPAHGGNPLQQVLRLLLERPVDDLHAGRPAGQPLGLVLLAPAQQAVGLFHQAPGIGAAIGFGVLVQARELLILADGGFDLVGGVVQRLVVDPHALGLLQQARRHGGHRPRPGPGVPRAADCRWPRRRCRERPGPPAAWLVRQRRARGRRSRPAPSSGRPDPAAAAWRAAFGGKRADRVGSVHLRQRRDLLGVGRAGGRIDRPAGERVGRRRLLVLVQSQRREHLAGLGGRGAGRVAFLAPGRGGPSSACRPCTRQLYCTPRASAWEISESAAARSFSAMACRARRSRSAVCWLLSSDGLSAGADCPTAAAPSQACDVPHDGSSRRDSRRKNDRHRDPADKCFCGRFQQSSPFETHRCRAGDFPPARHRRRLVLEIRS